MASDLALFPDAELLARYRSGRAPEAFAQIVGRHGAMVYRTCLRLVINPQDAEDATQAVFLVLARRCQTVNGSLGGWLHKVAHDTALKLLRGRTRQERRDKAAAMMRANLSLPATADIREEVDAALTRLPAHLREAVVLRYLEGWGQEEAAVMAGCPRGTLSWRATEGLNRLRSILARRGTVVAPTALAGFLSQEATAAVPATLPAAVQHAVINGGASAQVVQLAQGVNQTMALAKAKAWIATVVGLAAVGVPLTMYLARPAAPSLHATFRGHTDPVQAVAFSPNGKLLATGSNDKTVRIWDVASRKELFNHPMNGWVHALVFSPEGKTLAAADGFQTVRLWDVASGQSRVISVEADKSREVLACYCLAFAPDGKTLAAAAQVVNVQLNGRVDIHIWDAASLRKQATIRWEEGRVPRQLVFSADGRTLNMLGVESRGAEKNSQWFGPPRSWDIASRQQVPAPALFGRGLDNANVMALAGDGRTWLGFQDGKPIVWRPGTESAPLRLEQPPLGVMLATISPANDRFALGSPGDLGIAVWDAAAPATPLLLPKLPDRFVNSLRFSPDGRSLALGCHDGTVEVWNVPGR